MGVAERHAHTGVTDVGIARLRPGEREYTVWDSRLPGLGVRVRPSGGLSWIFLRKTGGGTRRVSLGPGALKTVTGCRRNGIVRLRWAEVRDDCLVLTDSNTGPRKVPLNRQSRRVLERQPRVGSPFVFPSPRDPSGPRGVNLPLWYSVRREAGIEDVRLHDLRHSPASHAVMNGVPVPVVSRLLGHSNVRMTLRYAHLADRDLEAAAERGRAVLGRGARRAEAHTQATEDPMKVWRIAPCATIALALSALPALAQVGEADRCLKVHSTECKTYGGIRSMGFVIQNICDRHVVAFVRKQSYTAAHPEEKGYWRSYIRITQLRRHLRKPKYQGNGSTPCAKRPRWAFCAEYKPDNLGALTDDYINAAPYIAMLKEKSACFREITGEPFVHDGHKFRPATRIGGAIPARREDRHGIFPYDVKKFENQYCPEGWMTPRRGTQPPGSPVSGPPAIARTTDGSRVPARSTTPSPGQG